MKRTMFRYSKEKIEFMYSVFLLFIIPILIILCGLLLMLSVQNSFDKQLRQRATALNGVITVAVGMDVANSEKVNEILVSIKDSQDELRYTDVLITTPRQNEYRVIASTDSKRASVLKNDVQYGAVVNQKSSITREVQTDGARTIRVVTPLFDAQDRVLALVETEVTTSQTDALLNSSYVRVAFAFAITVISIVLLLLNQFRLSKYTLLFRKIKEVDELQSDFLSIASRELRDPVTVLNATIENILDGVDGRIDERVKDSLLHVTVETDRLNKLVCDLAVVSNIEQNQIKYKMEVFDVADIIDSVIKKSLNKAAAKDVRLRYNAPARSISVQLDKERFADIMTNLIDNAIKYSRRGEVVVYHKDSMDLAIICVKDSGIGMGANARDRLFRRFYRIDNDKTKRIPGTGLGLWITKQYVDNMNGDIQIDSLEGKGSEFTVSFPMGDSNEERGN